MEQSQIMAFELGMDRLMLGVKNELVTQQQVSVTHQTMPQCLDCLRVIDEQQRAMLLRFVLVGCSSDMTLGRLSWMEENGREHVCCYLNDAFDTVKRKSNGLWVKEKHSAATMCLRKWSRLHSPVPS